MPDPQALVEARDQALLKIGRNVVNFQKMEMMLKGLLKLGNYSAPLSKLKAHFELSERRHQSETMGNLVNRTFKALAVPPEPPPTDNVEPWVTSHFTIKGEEWGPKQWRKEMRMVVSERNRLIHHMPAQLDPRSIESCNALSAELDAQKERILPAYKQLEEMVKAIAEYTRYMHENQDEIIARWTNSGPSHDA